MKTINTVVCVCYERGKKKEYWVVNRNAGGVWRGERRTWDENSRDGSSLEMDGSKCAFTWAWYLDQWPNSQTETQTKAYTTLHFATSLNNAAYYSSWTWDSMGCPVEGGKPVDDRSRWTRYRFVVGSLCCCVCFNCVVVVVVLYFPPS